MADTDAHPALSGRAPTRRLRAGLSGAVQVFHRAVRQAPAAGVPVCRAERGAGVAGRAGGRLAMVEPVAVAEPRGVRIRTETGRCAADPFALADQRCRDAGRRRLGPTASLAKARQHATEPSRVGCAASRGEEEQALWQRSLVCRQDHPFRPDNGGPRARSAAGT